MKRMHAIGIEVVLLLAVMLGNPTVLRAETPSSSAQRAPKTVEEKAALEQWKQREIAAFKKAEAAHPDLQQEGSALNSAVKSAIAQLEKVNPEFFNNPEWICLLVQRLTVAPSTVAPACIPAQAAAAAPTPSQNIAQLLVDANKLLADASKGALPGETYDQAMARRQQAADAGLYGSNHKLYVDRDVQAEVNRANIEEGKRNAIRLLAGQRGIDITALETRWSNEDAARETVDALAAVQDQLNKVQQGQDQIQQKQEDLDARLKRNKR